MAEQEIIYYDVVIVGAGPAGCSCALALKDAGLKVALIDKATFPRDKVCGDAIPGRAIKTLRAIDPKFETAFKEFAEKEETRKTALYYRGNELTFNWVQPAYTCARMSFDHFLFALVQQNTNTALLTDTQPDTIVVKDDAVEISLKDSAKLLSAQLVIGADGAHSAVAKQLTDRTLDRNHHVGSVRAYYRDVAHCNADTTEIYFDKRFLPSYLWVFPLPGGVANVGFGMLSSEIARKKINIRKTFYEFIEAVPELKAKFANAKQIGPLEGFGLPLGSKIGALSGNRFLLTGDAASLIDPVSGDGIGNAMLSGRLAAQQAIKCFAEQDFTEAIVKQYDASLLASIGKELRDRHRAQKILSKMPSLLDVAFLAGKNALLRKMIQKAL